MFKIVRTKKKPDEFVNTETFINTITDIKVRLDLIEDDIRRLRKKPPKPSSKDTDRDEDETIIKSIEDDGFKEIRELNRQFGKTNGKV